MHNKEHKHIQKGKVFSFSNSSGCGIISLNDGIDDMYEFTLENWKAKEKPKIGMNVLIIDNKITLQDCEYNKINKENSANGKIFSFDTASGSGLILLLNGEKFKFNIDNWSIPDIIPTVGMDVSVNDNKITLGKSNNIKKEEQIKIDKISEGTQKTTVIISIISIILFLLVIFATSGDKNSSSNSSYQNNELGCYTIGYKAGSCFQRSYNGLECKAGTDIIIPERCKNKYSTEKGFKAGTASER